MKYPVGPHLPLLVSTTTTEGNGVNGPILHVHMTATVGAPIPTRTLINPNAGGRTVQRRVSRTLPECESGT